MKNIIEEEIEGIPISKIINIIYKNQAEFKIGENKLDTKNLKEEFPKTLIDNLVIYLGAIYIDITYKGEVIPQSSKIFEIEDKDKNRKLYKIYTKQYYELIIKENGIINPMMIIDDRVFKSDFDNIDNYCNFPGLDTYTFKIVEDKKIDYQKEVFDEIINEKTKKTGKYYSKNFHHYFKYQKSDDIFNYKISQERSQLYQNLKNNSDKIKCYCGPHGIGKTTTFLALKKELKNLCYFNLKFLFENINNILVWKNELILLEVAETFKTISTYDQFTSLAKELEPKTQIWESIICVINFAIKENIKIKFILDQYKEKLDLSYTKIQKIINLINEDENKYASLLVLSSINDKDVRISLLNYWFGISNERGKNILIYTYIPLLFNLKEIIDEDPSLSEAKKNLLNQEFNNIQKYYYRIKNVEDDSLEKFKNDEKIHIKKKINEFFNDNTFNFDDIILVIQYYYYFGITSNFEKDIFEKLVNILPFKYFIIDLINYSISYSFPLVENIFQEILMEKSAKILKNPFPSLKPSVVGDILEFNVINDLSLNNICKFNYVCKVNSFYNLNNSNYTHFENIENSTILFVQLNAYAKNFDFGILNKGEDLILFQCKKALMKKPSNYVKFEDLIDDKDILAQNFKTKYGINIKRIYLLYITGITFYSNKGKNEYKTWGIEKKEDFKILEKMCKNSQCELIYYDVNKKKIYKKEDSFFSSIHDLIFYVKQFKIHQKVGDNEDSDNSSDEDNIDFINTTLINIRENIKQYNEKEDILNQMEKNMLLNNNILKNYKILGFKTKPNHSDLNLPIYTIFIREGKKYLSYRDEKNRKKILEIFDDTVQEIKDYGLLFDNKTEKCYYLKNES